MTRLSGEVPLSTVKNGKWCMLQSKSARGNQ